MNLQFVRVLKFLQVKRLMIVLGGSLCLSLASPGQEQAKVKEVPAKAQQWSFTDISGEKQEPFGNDAVSFLVVVFIAVDCPIANYYQPTIRRLAKAYEEKGVRVLLFHTDPDLTSKMIKEHANTFKISSPVFHDAGFALAKRLKATTTPEAFVISRDGLIKYRGRIDDTYAAWGKKRRVTGSHDLQDALKAVLSGKDVKEPVTKPIGCYIPFELAGKNAPGEGE